MFHEYFRHNALQFWKETFPILLVLATTVWILPTFAWVIDAFAMACLLYSPWMLLQSYDIPGVVLILLQKQQPLTLSTKIASAMIPRRFLVKRSR
jgi:hypothetical protein